MSSKQRKGGYGDPPPGKPFEPGKSGNPNGRPKKVKSLAEHLEDALRQKVPIQENGRDVKKALGQVIFFNLATEAARRNQRAVKNLLDTMRLFQVGFKDAGLGIDRGELSKADEAMLSDYLARMLAEQMDASKPPDAPSEENDKGNDIEKGPNNSEDPSK